MTVWLKNDQELSCTVFTESLENVCCQVIGEWFEPELSGTLLGILSVLNSVFVAGINGKS